MALHADNLAMLTDMEAYWREHGLVVTERTTTHPTSACAPCTEALIDAINMATVTGSLGCNSNRSEAAGTEHSARWHRAPVSVR